MKTSLPRVYVGIVSYNSARLLPRCLMSLKRQCDANVYVVVLDNNSTDNVSGVMSRYQNDAVFIRSGKNLGFGGGHNAILRSLRLRDNDYYMALNPDALPEPDCIANLVKSMNRHGADWATGKLYKDTAGKILYSAGHALFRDGYAFNIGYGIVDSGQYDSPREVFGASGAAALYRGSMIRTVSQDGNFFDPRLFMYYEDIDVDWRAQLAGLHCWYEPSAVVRHPGGEFPRSLEAEVLANRFLSVWKNAFFIDLILYNVPVMVFHVLARLMITPLIGIAVTYKLLRRCPGVLLSRISASVSRRRMTYWFAAALVETSLQSVGYGGRLRKFFRRLLRA